MADSLTQAKLQTTRATSGVKLGLPWWRTRKPKVRLRWQTKSSYMVFRISSIMPKETGPYRKCSTCSPPSWETHISGKPFTSYVVACLQDQLVKQQPINVGDLVVRLTEAIAPLPKKGPNKDGVSKANRQISNEISDKKWLSDFHLSRSIW